MKVEVLKEFIKGEKSIEVTTKDGSKYTLTDKASGLEIRACITGDLVIQPRVSNVIRLKNMEIK